MSAHLRGIALPIEPSHGIVSVNPDGFTESSSGQLARLHGGVNVGAIYAEQGGNLGNGQHGEGGSGGRGIQFHTVWVSTGAYHLQSGGV